VKIDLTVIDWKDVEWIELVWDSVQFGTVVQMVEYLRFKQKKTLLYQL
jgi:hypothetical protein